MESLYLDVVRGTTDVNKKYFSKDGDFFEFGNMDKVVAKFIDMTLE